MRLNMIRFKVAAKKRHHRKENLPIGSAIKFKRHALKMTLEEASENICSVSYLSKLENNIIVPSEKYVIKLKQRFCIDEDHLDIDNNVYQGLKYKLIISLLNDRKLPETYEHHIGTQMNYQTSLLKLGLYILNKKNAEIHQTYQQIIPMISSMPDEEFAILICLVSQMLFDESRYQEASELLTEMTYDGISDILLLYRDKWLLINAIQMENSSLFHLLYPSYQEKLIKLGYYKQINDLQIQRMTYFSQRMSISSYKKLLSHHQGIPKKNYVYAKALNLFANQQYKAVLNLINEQVKTMDSKWFIIKLKTLDGLHHKDEIKHLLKMQPNVKLSNDQKLIVSFIKTKHMSSKENLLIYLRHVILGNNFLTDNVQVLKYLQKSSHRLFSKYFYYKEATEVFHKFNHKIELLKKSLSFSSEEPTGSFFV